MPSCQKPFTYWEPTSVNLYYPFVFAEEIVPALFSYLPLTAKLRACLGARARGRGGGGGGAAVWGNSSPWSAMEVEL